MARLVTVGIILALLMLATRIAALSEVLFAVLIGAFALGIPFPPSEAERGALLMLGAQAGLALLAAAGLFRHQRWAWLAALSVIALAFGPLGIAIYRAWRAGLGVGITMPTNAVPFVVIGWIAQGVVVICFLMARGRPGSMPGTL